MKTMATLMISTLVFAVFFGGCRTNPTVSQTPAEPELPGLSITLWSDRTELFMEYPTLVSGQEASFSVHLTDLGTFRPLAGAKVALEMEKGGTITQFVSRISPRPGIFRVDVRSAEPGRYRSVLKVEAPQYLDRHPLGELVVHNDKTAALADFEHPSTPGEIIRFLKEQQWGSDFSTELAVPRKIQESLQVPAIVKPRGGAEGIAVSPVRGYLKSASPLPIPGHTIQKGQIIATVFAFTSTPQDPAGLQLELAQSETNLAESKRVRKRTEDLLSERAIPARRVEEAHTEEIRAQARVDAAKARLAQYEQSRSGNAPDDGTAVNAFQVKAPISGMVTQLLSAEGGVVEEGQEILHIPALDRVWVEAEVPEGDIDILRTLKSAELDVPGMTMPVVIPGLLGRIERIGSMVNMENRRIPVIFEMQNRDHLFRIGQSMTARLRKGEAREQISLSLTSIVDDGGRSIVFQQADGESFQRKVVRTGSVEGGYIQILEGIAAGARVVNKCAYLIRLAALSTQIPAHGHVH